MSFLEFWGERVDPGKMGGVEFGQGHEACQCRPLVVARFVFVVIGLPILWSLAVPYVPLPLWQAWLTVIGLTLIYVALSYLVDPQPDMGNIGWAGGLIDHGWRYSDDVNRFLLGLKCLLGPGRFIAESVADMLATGQPEDEPPARHLDDDQYNRI